MIASRLALGAAAGAALATIVGVAVGAAAFALYAGLEPYTGRAFAALVVALAAFALAAVIVWMIGRPRARKAASANDPSSMAERVMEIVRRRPLVAASAAGLAAILAVRNPMLVVTLLGALTKARKPPSR